MSQTTKSYIVCCTPRTGSTLLCSLLQATGVAGKPESYFRSQDVAARVDGWGIRQPDGSFDFRDFLNCVLERGRTDNEIFSTRIMWGTMEAVTSNLRSIGMNGSDLEVLTQAFGETKFVFLERYDAVAQAISRLRAEQTDVWHIKRDGDQAAARRSIHYDAQAIQQYIDESSAHVCEWNTWFQQHHIVPLRLSYEDLDLDGDAEARKVLDFIGIDFAAKPTKTNNVRMADETSRQWAQRFKAETGYSD